MRIAHTLIALGLVAACESGTPVKLYNCDRFGADCFVVSKHADAIACERARIRHQEYCTTHSDGTKTCRPPKPGESAVTTHCSK